MPSLPLVLPSPLTPLPSPPLPLPAQLAAGWLSSVSRLRFLLPEFGSGTAADVLSSDHCCGPESCT